MNDDETVRKQRAEQLRRRIDELTSDTEDPAADSPAQKPGESDAEYIHRRMRDIDRKQNDGAG